MKQKKFATVSKECVACGCCMKVCPLKAISIPTGIRAQVDSSKCVGCGKCAVACPAQTITIIQREEMNEKAKALV